MNIDIFACINFRGFMEIGNFACIKIRVLCIIGSLDYKVIFEVYIFSRIYKKRELRENMYTAKISTFTVTMYDFSLYRLFKKSPMERQKEQCPESDWFAILFTLRCGTQNGNCFQSDVKLGQSFGALDIQFHRAARQF